jgi:hypothetical protein
MMGLVGIGFPNKGRPMPDIIGSNRRERRGKGKEEIETDGGRKLYKEINPQQEIRMIDLSRFTIDCLPASFSH